MDEEKDLNEGQTPGEEGQAEDTGNEAKENSGTGSSEASQEGIQE